MSNTIIDMHNSITADELEKIVRDVDYGQEPSALTDQVCEALHTPVWKSNPLFARTVACCRRARK